MYSILVIVSFLVLATLAAVEYSGQAENDSGVKGDAVSKTIRMVIKKVDNSWLFANKQATSTNENSLESEKKNKIFSRFQKYVRFDKTEAGWQLTLQNEDEIIFQKIILLKRAGSK